MSTTDVPAALAANEPFVFSPAEEVVIEHLGFVFMSVVDEVINAANEAATKGLNELEAFTTAEYAKAGEEDEVMDLENEKGISQFETLLLESLDKRFDQFETYCVNDVFNLPPGLDIRLPYQESMDFSLTEEDEKAVDTELEELRKKLAAQKLLNHKLSTRMAQLSSRVPASRALREALPSLRPSTEPADLAALTASLTHIAELVRRTLPSVVDPAAPSGGRVPVGPAATRTGYIRSLVRRQVDRLARLEKRRQSGETDRARMEREEEEEIATGDMEWVQTDVEGIAEAKELNAKLLAAMGRTAEGASA
ncbi:Mis12 protein-domain-containing protein [Hyaloraphidium curvatum]|nr:Mis12 protein-domain-containing protein [Hyaloraphidium curvatum]